MPSRSSLPSTVLSISTLAIALLGAAGCNAHPIKSVSYEREQVCSESVDIPVLQPEVVLVVDRSGSMSDNPLGEGTRWEALHGVISEVVSGQDATTQFGLSMFPAGDAGATWVEGACNPPTALDVSVGVGNASAILGAMPPADAETMGGTPAAAAVELAADHLRTRGGEQPKLMVLVTDGAANCAVDAPDWQLALDYDEQLQAAVADAQLDGINTYVVGIQISGELDEQSGVVPAEQLDEVAQLGGAALEGEHAFYSVEDQAMLSEALRSITAEISCTMELGAEVDPEREALLTVDDQVFEQVADCADADGWVYGADGSSLQLCGQACTQFQATGDIVFEYLCE